MRRSHRRSRKVLSMFLVGAVTAGAAASPRDVMDGAPAPAPTAAEGGDATSVAEQVGAFQYSYPIVVPPGRLGMEPSLALSYSSRSPVHGGLAAGWQLSVPEVRIDPGMPALSVEDVVAGVQREPWIGALSGGARLIAGADGRWSAEHDDRYVDYRLVEYGGGRRWEARTLDGQVYVFGHGAHLSAAASRTANRFPLTEHRDRWGNTVSYRWTPVVWRGEVVDLRLASVEYTSNEARGLGAHARVELDWADPVACHVPDSFSGGIGDPSDAWDTPIGASLTFVAGARQHPGASALQAVRTYALRDAGGASMRLVREVELEYDADTARCDAPHTPYRAIRAIRGRAVAPDGASTELPSVELDYYDGARRYEPVPFAWTGGAHGEKGRRHAVRKLWPELETMLIDLDGDGLLDRMSTTNPARCEYTWQKGTGSGFSPIAQFGTLPSLPSDPRYASQPDQGCWLNFQRLYLRNVDSTCDVPTPKPSYLAYRFVDLVGDDGAPDLVAQLHYDHHWFSPHDYMYAALGQHRLPPCGEAASRVCWMPREDDDTDCLDDASSGGKLDLARYDACLEHHAEPVPCDEMLIDRSDPGLGATPMHASADDAKQAIQDACAADPDCDDGGSEAPPSLACGFGGQSYDISCPDMAGQQAPEPVAPVLPTCRSQGLVPHVRGCWQEYVWLVWKNNGDGTFASTSELVRSPIPLDASTDAAIPASGGNVHDLDAEGVGARRAFQPDIYHTQHSLIDLNGDGHLDAVRRGIGYDADRWYVWLGDGRGAFHGHGDKPIHWRLPAWTGLSHGATLDVSYVDALGVTRIRRITTQYSGLVDVNGDGRPDLVIQGTQLDPSLPRLLVYFNTGDGFAETPQILPAELGRRLSASVARPTRFQDDHHFMREGIRFEYTTTRDLDGDGRVEMIALPRGEDADACPSLLHDAVNASHAWVAGCLHVYKNTGSGFARRGQLTELEQDLLAKTNADDTSWWETRALRDYTGDGLPDIMRTAGHGVEILGERNDDHRAPRLLRRIRDGRGTTTDVRYAAHTNRAVVTQTGARSHAGAMWVVASTTTTDRFGPASTTSYRYVDPVSTEDDRGERGFRGFAQVIATGPSGAVTASSFDYDVDWRGALAARRTYADEAARVAGQPSAITETTWRAFALGARRTFHAIAERAWHCGPGTHELACRSVGLHRGTAIEHATIRAPGASVDRAWVPTATYQLAGMFDPASPLTGYTPQPGDRVERTEHRLVDDDGSSAFTFDDGRLWLYPTRRTTRSLTPDALVAETTFVASADQRYLREACARVDASRAACAVTEHDAATGQPVWRARPEQVARARAAGLGETAWPVTLLAYDPAWLYPVETTNELGHRVGQARDPGTGAVTRQLGPNEKSVLIGGVRTAVRQQTVTRVDGLGRPVEVQVSVDDATAGFRLVTVRRVAYAAANLATGVPDTTTTEQRIDHDGDRWVTTRDERDGRGRVFRSTVRALGEPAGDAVTRYHYDPAGNLVEIHSPDPRGGSAAVVTRHLFDSLGRNLGMRRPDGAGVDVSYPAANTVVERDHTPPPAADDPIAEKRLYTDGHGRITRVVEVLDGGGEAHTVYRHDALDRVAAITDPDGVATAITYDLAGNRTRIDRDGRAWTYGYDLNGNLATATLPRPSGASVLAYTTSYAYDDLDRLTSTSPAPMGLSAELATVLLSDRPTVTVYDTAPNGVGLPARVQMPFGTLAYAYDAAGLPTREAFTLDLAPAGHPQLRVTDRAEDRTFNALGQPVTVSFASVAPGASPDVAYTYDARGLPQSVAWTNYPYNRNGTPPFYDLIARYERNAAGLVTLQHRPGYGPERRTFTYDARGRVVRDEIRRSEIKSLETMDYYATGDLRSMTSFRKGLPTRTFQFAYDRRHQLTAASDDHGFDAVFEYGAGGRFASAYVAADAATVTTRDVSYVYEAAHREALAALRAPDGTDVATFAYDAAGNTVVRDTAGAAQRYVYDASQRLRMARDGSAATVYYYAPDGRRLAALHLVSDAPSAPAASLRAWLGAAEIFLHGDGTADESYAHVTLGDQRVLRIRGTAKRSFVYHNGLGHMVLAGSGNDILDAFVYSPFGELLAETGRVTEGAVPESGDVYWKRFNGKEYDFETGYYYYGHRYYDPLAMQWNRPDPLYKVGPDLALTEPRRANLYAFSLNNPLRYVDPDGRDGCDKETDAEDCVKDIALEVVTTVDGSLPAETFGTVASEGINTRGGLAKGLAIYDLATAETGEEYFDAGLGLTGAVADTMSAFSARAGWASSGVLWLQVSKEILTEQLKGHQEADRINRERGLREGFAMGAGMVLTHGTEASLRGVRRDELTSNKHANVSNRAYNIGIWAGAAWAASMPEDVRVGAQAAAMDRIGAAGNYDAFLGASPQTQAAMVGAAIVPALDDH